jgi:DNA ligase-1
MAETLFAELAQLGERLERTTKRGELAALLAGFLKSLPSAEAPAAVRLIIGRIFPEWDSRTLNVSGQAVMAVIEELVDASPTLRDEIYGQAADAGEAVRVLLERAPRQPLASPPLTLVEVFEALGQIAETEGRGSRTRKMVLLRGLFSRASAVEAKFLVKIIFGEMRHGVDEGILLDGIAQAAGVKPRVVQRANQVWGDLGKVALSALTAGEAGLRTATVSLFQPIKPMLAQTAEDPAAAFGEHGGRVAVEYKLDGARVQIHARGQQVRIYSRQLSDVTDSLPDVVAEVREKLTAAEAILEGEVVAVSAEGRPLPFQHLMRRFRRKHEIEEAIVEIPVRLHLFDALYVDARSLIDAPNTERWAALEQVAGSLGMVRRLIPGSLEEFLAFAQAAIGDGHEGVMIKDLDSTYTPGVRGKAWLKLKHAISVDLVVVAADWGYGRRHGWLSNYHLAARDSVTGQYMVVGKTFKGLTDTEFREMTERLLALEQSRRGSTVFVRPQVVVEVLFNEIQASSQYPSGLSLRFARVSRIRDDKPPVEAESLQNLRRLFDQQFERKGRLT